jgi:hypothetical protein
MMGEPSGIRDSFSCAEAAALIEYQMTTARDAAQLRVSNYL